MIYIAGAIFFGIIVCFIWSVIRDGVAALREEQERARQADVERTKRGY